MKNPYPYEYVCLLGIDGMGAFHKQCHTPCLDAIFKNGATTFSSMSMDPTISAENWAAMLLGADPIVHKMTNASISEHENPNPDLPSVFTRIRAAFPDAYLASCSHWDAINHGIIEHNVGVDMHTTATHADADMLPQIEACVAKKPKYLFIQFDDIDSAGHGLGFGTDAYLKEIERIDRLAGQVYAAYEKNGILDKTLFLVTADHGGIRVGHGDFSDAEKYVFLGAVGARVPHGTIGRARTKDMAAIVLYALGVDVPVYDENGFSSQVPSGIFPELPDTYRWVEPKPIHAKGMPTPDLRADNGLYSFIDPSRVEFAWFCNGKAEDATGKHAMETSGLIKYYSIGIMDEMAECGSTGFATVPDLKLPASFSVCLWLETDPRKTEAVAVAGTSDFFWRNRSMPGLSCSLRTGDVMFTIGNGDDHFDGMVAFPPEVGDGWVHTVFAFDGEKGTVKVYYNFRLVTEVELPPQYRGLDYNNLPFVIGNDGHKTHNNEYYDLTFRMDDFLIVDGAMTPEEVKKLGAYYGK